MKYSLTLIIFLLPVMLFGQGVAGTWTTVSSVGFTPRYGLTSSVIGTKIYVIAGKTDKGTCDTVEVYDPLNDTWNSPVISGTFTRRYYHTASVVAGKIYLIGGGAPSLVSTVEIFDPLTNTRSIPTTTGSFTPRQSLTSSVVGNKIYVFGGMGKTFSDLFNVVEVFDPSTNSWSTPPTTGTFTPRAGLSSVVIGDKIYVFGGYTEDNTYKIEVFDPATNEWSTPPVTTPFPARVASSVCVLNGKVFVIGGTDESSNAINAVDIFDPSTNSWSTPLTTGELTRRGGLATAVVEGKIYAMGGFNSTGVLNDNQIFTPSGSNSIIDKNNFSSISLFPNPTNGIIVLRGLPLSSGNISVMNVLGETVLEMKNIQASECSLDLSNLPAGTFFVKYRFAGFQGMNMVVKE